MRSITACAYQAVNIDNKYNGAPVQVRVVMGKEPRHFLAIFKGKLIIFEVHFLFFAGYKYLNAKKSLYCFFCNCSQGLEQLLLQYKTKCLPLKGKLQKIS